MINTLGKSIIFIPQTHSNNLNEENQYENKTVKTLRTKALKVDIDMIDESGVGVGHERS